VARFSVASLPSAVLYEHLRSDGPGEHVPIDQNNDKQYDGGRYGQNLFAGVLLWLMRNEKSRIHCVLEQLQQME
jgi:hypothetical protein